MDRSAVLPSSVVLLNVWLLWGLFSARFSEFSSQGPIWYYVLLMCFLNIIFVFRGLLEAWNDTSLESDLVDEILEKAPMVMMVINGLFAVIFLLIILAGTIMAVGFMGIAGLFVILVGLVLSPSNWAPVISFLYAYYAYVGRDE